MEKDSIRSRSPSKTTGSSKGQYLKLFIQKLALSATILPLAAVGAFASTSQTADNPATITLPVAQGDPFPICPKCTSRDQGNIRARA